MSGSEKGAAAPQPTPPALPPTSPLQYYCLKKILNPPTNWQELFSVRTMILLSLLLQIALFVLGKRRKHISLSPINKMILWFAYQSKDWVTTATLGKLSSFGLVVNALQSKYNQESDSSLIEESDIDPILRSLWAPLLILHLGGPDTITAYSFQDTQLWTRHLLALGVQSSLAFSAIFLSSWTYEPHWSFYAFVIPLCFVGIIKYIERILCLKGTNSKKTKQIISISKNPANLSHPILENQEAKIVLLGYALFSAMRPDVNDYLCHKEYLESLKVRIRTHLRETNHQVKLILQDLLERDKDLTHFDIAVVELGFVFDVVYTKAAFIYTKKGCILRLTSLTLSIGMLVFYIFVLASGGYPNVDNLITVTLLVGVVALDICAMFSILCSNWAVILMYNNCLARKILQYVLHHFPCFLRQQKKWSARMGQFDLLDYCLNSRKARVYRFLKKCCSCDILENWYRFKYTRFVEVPSCLKPKEVYRERLDSFFSSDSFEATRGEKTLDELGGAIRPDVESSIKVDFDASIIAWHLATSICYHQDSRNPNKAMESSKYLSDYMMYLLVMRPAMLLPEGFGSFWLDHALDKLKDAFSTASNKDAAFDSLLSDLPEFRTQTALENLPKYAMENLPKYAGYLAEKLNQHTDRWKLIEAMWIEMLLYAAHSHPHVTHVKHLRQYGREFLTIIWVMGGHRIIQEAIKD